MKTLVLSLVLVASFASCSRPIDDKELVGTYVAEYSYAREELELKANRTYFQKISVYGQGGVTSHSGTWEYQSSTGRLTLSDPLLVDDNFGKLNPNYKISTKGIWGLNAERSLGNITLNWNDDSGVRFKKST